MKSKDTIKDIDYELEKARIRKQVKLAEYKKEYIKELKQEIQKDRKKNPHKKYKKKDPTYFFITINPIECTISDLTNIINIIMKRKFVNIYCYTFEQRGTTLTDIGKGKHIHLIIDKTIAKSDAIKYIHNSIKKYCTQENIDIREITENGKIIRENYMRGHKTFDKLESVEIDNIWRKENNLSDFYQVSKKVSPIDIENIIDDEHNIIENEIDIEKGFQNMKVKISTNKKTITLMDEKGELKVYSLVELNK